MKDHVVLRVMPALGHRSNGAQLTVIELREERKLSEQCSLHQGMHAF